MPLRLTLRTVCLLALVLALSACRPPAPIQDRMFGLHIGQAGDPARAMPSTSYGAMRLWDSGTTWLSIETSDGVFDWSTLDTAVARAYAAGARPLVVLGQTPTFHASRPTEAAAYGPGAASMPDLDAWRRYVRATAERYGDRVDYQVWNEPNVEMFWTGSPAAMARLTRITSETLRASVPRAALVAPSFPLRREGQREWFADFWSQQPGGRPVRAFVDVAAIHTYPLEDQLPEAQQELIDFATQTLAEHKVDLPVWNTEVNFGLGAEQTSAYPLDDATQAAFVVRTWLINAAAGIERVYWYRWDLHLLANTFLSEADAVTPTSAGRAFATAQDWLVGARVQWCGEDRGIHTCLATRGRQAWVFYWKPTGPPATVRAPRQAVQVETVDGTSTRTRRGAPLEVGPSPVRLTLTR